MSSVVVIALESVQSSGRTDKKKYYQGGAGGRGVSAEPLPGYLIAGQPTWIALTAWSAILVSDGGSGA